MNINSEHQQGCLNPREHHEPTLRNAFISLTKFIDILINEKVVNERNELSLVFSNWRMNNNFTNRWTIEYPHYYIRRDADMICIDKEVKKVLPTVKFIDFSVSESLNPASLNKGKVNRIKVHTKRQPFRGSNRYYYKAEIVH